MKPITFLIILLMGFSSQAQNSCDIVLSKNVKTEHMGLWINGDYKIYIELEPLELHFRNECKRYMQAIVNLHERDSAAVKYYRATLKRYMGVVEQIQHAPNNFDLRTLNVYAGFEDNNQNKGSSYLVETEVRQMVKKGAAIVFYRGHRIYSLRCKVDEIRGENFLNWHDEVRTYFDDPENCIFTEIEKMYGW